MDTLDMRCGANGSYRLSAKTEAILRLGWFCRLCGLHAANGCLPAARLASLV